MIFEMPPPSASHNKYVECFIYFKGYMPQHSIERVVPDGHVYLIFELDNLPRYTYDNDSLKPNRTFTKCWLSGLQKNFISISALPDSEMFVIKFKPGGAIPYMHTALDEVSDSVIPAEQVFGKKVLELRDLIYNTKTPKEKFTLANQFFSDLFNADFLPHESIYKAIHRLQCDPEFFETTMMQIIEESGYSKKHFIDLFKKSVGVTPKYFQRILRFNCIIPKVKQEQEISWPQISAECGFYDQAHFIREFKQFSGYNPESFLTEQRGHGEVNFFPIQ